MAAISIFPYRPRWLIPLRRILTPSWGNESLPFLVYCLNNGFTTSDLLHDVFRPLRPNKGFGILVVKPDVFFNGGY